MLLGPTGVGLEAIYDSVVNLAKTLADLGTSSSGIRQIASAVTSGDKQRIAITVITLRRICIVLGVLGAALLYLLRIPISEMAFNSSAHSFEIGLLSAIVLLTTIAGGQSALLQGTRRIGDLAKMKILGTLAGAMVSIPFVYIWGRDGIVPYMIIAAAFGLLISWLYARRVPIEKISVHFSDLAKETKNLLGLGLVFVATALMSTGALFLIRALVTRLEGIAGAGQFQAASALATIYTGFVLQAMGTDFYPRLTAAADDNERCNHLVNEQTEISILLALPGILFTLAVAPWVIQILYSDKFNQAAEILYWQVPGVFLQVNSWPIGFILLAKSRAKAFFWTDLSAYAVYVGLGWLGLHWFGLPGTGMAFSGLYLFHWIVLYCVAKKISGFRLSSENARLSVMGLAAICVILLARSKVSEPWSTIAGTAIALASSLYCLKSLVVMIGPEPIERFLRKIRMSFLIRLVPHNSKSD